MSFLSILKLLSRFKPKTWTLPEKEKKIKTLNDFNKLLQKKKMLFNFLFIHWTVKKKINYTHLLQNPETFRFSFIKRRRWYDLNITVNYVDPIQKNPVFGWNHKIREDIVRRGRGLRLQLLPKQIDSEKVVRAKDTWNLVIFTFRWSNISFHFIDRLWLLVIIILI